MFLRRPESIKRGQYFYFFPLFSRFYIKCNLPELLSADRMQFSHYVLGRRGADEETSAHVPCECEALATLRHIYLRSFFLDPEDVRGLRLGAIWKFFRKGLL
jgi:hypothetical protein